MQHGDNMAMLASFYKRAWLTLGTKKVQLNLMGILVNHLSTQKYHNIKEKKHLFFPDDDTK